MSFRDLQDKAGNDLLETSLCKAGAVLSNDEIRLLCLELSRTSADEAARIWLALLPPEDDRPGVAAPYMVGAPRDFPTGIGCLMAMAAFAKDETGTQKFADWLSQGSTYGEYFTGVDSFTIIQVYGGVMRTRAPSASMTVPRAYQRYLAAGGADRVWYILGTTALELKNGGMRTLIAAQGQSADANFGAAKDRQREAEAAIDDERGVP